MLAIAACTESAPSSPTDGDKPPTTVSNEQTPELTPAESPVPVETGRATLDRSSLFTPTEPPPPVDTAISTVEIEDVVFDTFRGGFVPLSQATPRIIESLRDAIKPIYEPKYEPLQSGDWLGDDELVIGYESASGGYAYPFSMLSVHEVVNDVIDGVPVLISYCPLCLSAVVYDRRLEDETLLFGNTSALYESDLVMYDHQTGSYWFQVLGEAIVGPMSGTRLTMLPSLTTSWGEWKRSHPETQILSRELGLLRSQAAYDRSSVNTRYQEALNARLFAFPVDNDKLDSRLSPGDRVFALQVDEEHKAYLLTREADWLVNDVVGEGAIVVVGRSRIPSATAFFANPDGQKLTFELVDGAVTDEQTGSRWDANGLAVSGPLQGSQLEPVPSRTSFWFSLVGALPGIELHTTE